MKLFILVLRCLQSRPCVLLIFISFLVILGKLFQERREFTYKSMFKTGENFMFFNRPYNRFTNSSTFIPGIRLKDIEPGARNFCNFKFGDTHSFKIDDSDISLTPEHSENGIYRVVYNAVYGDSYHNTSEDSRNNVTYCTHITPEFFYYIAEIVDRWEGPISISVFVPSTDASITLCLIERLCFCLPGMSRVAVHFIFPVEYPPDHWKCEPSLIVPQKCSVPEVISKEKLETFRNREGLVYPVNVARNVARVSARTTFVLVSDVELFPSHHLVSRFLAMLQRLKEKSGKDFRTLLKYFVYVLPVFEVESDAYVPETKSELLNLHSQNKAVYFHRWVCLHCQRFPGLQRWLHRKLPQLDKIIQPFLVVKREFPYHRWEPVYIGTHQEPLYSELLSWEGQQDKMTQMHEMCLLGYRFVILDGAFLVHAPGMKRRDSLQEKSWRRIHQSHNMAHYDTVISVTFRLLIMNLTSLENKKHELLYLQEIWK